MKRFDILRAAFYLIAIILLMQMLVTMVTALACVWSVSIEHSAPSGSCQNVAGWAREVWAEMLAAILALLVAARPPSQPPPPPENQHEDNSC